MLDGNKIRTSLIDEASHLRMVAPLQETLAT